MKQLWKDMLISGVMGLVLPFLVINLCTAVFLEQQPREVPAVPESRPSAMIKVRNQDGEAEEMELETYLVGVVMAEMPAYFETEALKAQAIVARTYACVAAGTGGKHGDGSICREPGCCQGYEREEDYLAQGGTPEAVAKIRSAVDQTAGKVLTYGGELIEATYFSCSGGRTEDAAAVWGQDYPYLRAVDSPGEEAAAYYESSQSFSLEELAQRLDIQNPEGWNPVIGQIQRTSGGGVDSMVLLGKIFRGTQLRSLLGLRSTAFDAVQEGSCIRFTTRGYGHRVGMSQYGADAMAAGGSTCAEILSHYYSGAELTQLRTGKLTPAVKDNPMG